MRARRANARLLLRAPLPRAPLPHLSPLASARAAVLTEFAPACMKEKVLADFNGRKLAIDASMAIYQFLVAVRSSDGQGQSQQLTNEAGEVTSHLQGLWYRTIKFVEAGIKPVYVFDGKPPTLKGGELAKRKAMKEKAQADLAAAKEGGNAEDIDRFSRRTVHMTKDMQEDCKKLLRLMGMPVVEAPCEAEAQCAALAKAGKVYAAASEDMDTLTFGSPRLVRRLWASEASKTPILEIDLEKALAGACAPRPLRRLRPPPPRPLAHPPLPPLPPAAAAPVPPRAPRAGMGLSMAQFVDVCILAGCDYCDTIKGIAALTAHKLVKEHGSLEKVIDSLDQEKHPVPEGVDFDEVRALFVSPDVADAETVDLKWNDPDEAGLLQFLVKEKGFNEERIAPGIKKLAKARGQGQQLRMDSFFKPVEAPAGSSSSSSSSAAGGGKRKADGKGGKDAGKKAKGGGAASGKLKKKE